MYLNRSSLSDGSSIKNKTATNRNRLTLSSRAGSHNPIPSSSPIIPSYPSQTSQNSFTITSNIHTATQPTTTSKTFTSTLLTKSSDPVRTSTPSIAVPHVQIVDIKPIQNDPLPDHYYYTEQDGDYFDSVEEISIPSDSNSSNSNIPKIESEFRFKIHALNEPRYDQSTLKSFFMTNNQKSTTTEGISLVSLKNLLATTKTSSTSAKPNFRDFAAQRQKILSFIVSENQPSSFKAPSTISTIQKSETNNNINKSSHSFNAFYNNKTYDNANAQDERLESTNTSKLNSNSSYVRGQTTKLLSSSSKTDQIKFIKTPLKLALSTTHANIRTLDDPIIKSQVQSLLLKPIEPTTYSPQKPYRVSTEVTKNSEISSTTFNSLGGYNIENENSNHDKIDELLVHSRRRPNVNDDLFSINKAPIRLSARSSTSIPENVSEITATPQATSIIKMSTESTTHKSIAQSFTSRGLIFKEILNKTFEPQMHSKPIVSPYISLETQRQTNAIQNTTPRITNLFVSKELTTNAPLDFPSSSTYRNFFFITAAPKNRSLFITPESISPQSISTKNAPVLNNVELSSSTENIRGKYRPFSLSSQVPNSIDDYAKPTTYSPRYRLSTKINPVQNLLTTIEEPVSVRRKIIRLKSSLVPPQETLTPREDTTIKSTSTERIDVTTYTPTKRVIIDGNFIPSPTRDTSDFRPIITKLNEFINRLSNSVDLFATVTPVSSSQKSTSIDGNFSNNNSSNNDNVESRLASVEELTEKPSFYYNKHNFNNNDIKSNNNNLTESHETTTKKFRATVEMPEMKVPPVNVEHNSSSILDYEEENDPLTYDDDISSMVSTKSEKIPFSTTTTIPFSTTKKSSLLTENDLLLSTLPTANPKSLIPPRATRVNNQLKSSIIASGLPRRNSNSASIKCNDVSSNAKCNEIPSRYTVI